MTPKKIADKVNQKKGKDRTEEGAKEVTPIAHDAKIINKENNETEKEIDNKNKEAIIPNEMNNTKKEDDTKEEEGVDIAIPPQYPVEMINPKKKDNVDKESESECEFVKTVKRKVFEPINNPFNKKMKSYHRWSIPQIHGEYKLTKEYKKIHNSTSDPFVYLNIGTIIKKQKKGGDVRLSRIRRFSVERRTDKHSTSFVEN